MDFCTSTPMRRHNPVDSICRKLQTIQWRGDREPNTPFQIPKLSSSSYHAPRSGPRPELDTILWKRTDRADREARRSGEGRDTLGMDPLPRPPKPTDVAYSVSSTSGQARGSSGAQGQAWQRYCSTPATTRFGFSRCVQVTHIEDKGEGGSASLPRMPSRSHVLSYNLNFCSAEAGGLDNELPYPALVVRRLSMGDTACTLGSESRKETMAEVSLICEEDLLDTIFHACDTQRKGKVYVSHIVDYLRHTTSRSSEDSGLEELWNMLDPDHKDVSIDLDTYHAVMKEWIDDRRSNGEEPNVDLIQDSVKCRDGLSVAKRSMLLNMTSGSLEAFGGEASRELETSELVYCVADLQMSSQKLEEEVRKLKQVVEVMEDSNMRLAEENEELRAQARVGQQLVHKEKMLKEELEEMKATLGSSEEGRARASAHSKHMERENQILITKITALQEENFKVTMEMDDLQRRVGELCDINTDLQVQVHSFDTIVSEKENLILEKSRQVEELKKVMEEYSAITELLRADKTKLENKMQMMLPDMSGSVLSLSAGYRSNRSISDCLQTELALAQSLLEGAEPLSPAMTGASSLDLTLDKEVLLLLQPNPEHMSLEFRGLFSKMKNDFRDQADFVLSAVRGLLDNHQPPEGSSVPQLLAVQGELDSRSASWVQGLDQLAQYTDSLEKEVVKMASNMRRSRTEILHLSVRVQEQENQKRRFGDGLKSPQDSREASCQAGEWDEECALQDFLKTELAEQNNGAQEGWAEVFSPETSATATSRTEQDEGGGEERWTVAEEEGTEGGEKPRDTSTPLPSTTEAEQLAEYSSVLLDPEGGLNSQPFQEEAAAPKNAHSQTAGAESHDSPPAGSDHDQINTPANTPPSPSEMVQPKGTLSGQDETIIQNGSPQPGGEEDNLTPSDMSLAKGLSMERLAERAIEEDSASLLPVLVEEEEGAPDSVAVVMAGTDSALSENIPPPPAAVTGQSGAQVDQSVANIEDALSDANKSKVLESTDTIQDDKDQEDLSEASVTTEKEETSVISDTSEAFREGRNSLCSNDKDIEAEFQRLSLGFKCDLFTLEKRLRLEERSRDLAEDNVRREISSCQGLLQALTPLCEDDQQCLEIILRLQKNLDILIQSMTRVSSRSEMLGAIHQENRIGRAVEVMVQHVENLRRMYTKEHAELLELRQTLMQSERSFGSQTERVDFRGKTQSSSQYYKSSARRVSIATIPRSGAGNLPFDTPKAHESPEGEVERLTRRSTWNVSGKSAARPPLKRFISSGSWAEPDEPSPGMKGAYIDSDCQSDEETQREEVVPERRRSSLSELGSKLTAFILPLKTPSLSPCPAMVGELTDASLSQSLTSSSGAAAAVVRGGHRLWLWLAMLMVLAGLLALLASLVMQPAVEAAPVGTGDSWTTIQQLLWPYTGLRHNGQPPV